MNAEVKSAPDGWWHDLYDGLLADVLLERSSTDVEDTVRFLIESRQLREGDRVFDQCCGIGSVAIPLARRGYQVEGMDLAEGYVERARTHARREQVSIAFWHGDAFECAAKAPCAGAFNWWTSFGYRPGDEENAQMLARAFESLRPGGRFALDFMNVPGVLHHFRPVVVVDRDTPRGPVRLTRTSHYEASSGRLHKLWQYETADGRHVEHPSSVRAYTPPELQRLFSRVGFVDVSCVGDLRAGALTLDSERCVVLARRPL